VARLGKATDVAPGQMRLYNADGTRVTVANVDGHLYAFDDTCTHRGCSLAEGELDGTTVTCACHGSQFDVRTGEVLEGPAEEPVGSWVVEIEDGDLLVRS
jgi:3-phenylpropionate/trans-cinnamate dioxygenase ferredoxin component